MRLNDPLEVVTTDDLSKVMDVVRKLLRIYTPFICTLVALIYGVLLLMDIEFANADYILSAVTGNSIIVVAYMWATSKRMCIWYKLNLLCLLLIHIDGLIYFLSDMNFTPYCYSVILIATAGLIFFIIYRVIAGITKVIC